MSIEEGKYGAWPKTEAELLEYIQTAQADANTYEGAAEFMKKVAVAAFNYASHVAGCTGFQASWAGLRFLATTRGMEGPFILLDANNALYPQYPSPAAKAAEWQNSDDVRNWLRTKAQKLLDEKAGQAHPDVVAHWKKLAAE